MEGESNIKNEALRRESKMELIFWKKSYRSDRNEIATPQRLRVGWWPKCSCAASTASIFPRASFYDSPDPDSPGAEGKRQLQKIPVAADTITEFNIPVLC